MRRSLLALALGAATILAFWLAVAPPGGALPFRHDLLTWPGIGARLDGWRRDVAAAPLQAGLVYVAAYAGLVALSVPAGGAMSVLGGALFGPWAGGALAVLGASTGAVLLFLLARGVLGPLCARVFARGAGPLIERLRPALARDGFAALLAMRLLPVVPFWLGNLAPAVLGMRLAPYAAATVLGIIPATFVLAGIGAGAGGVLARGQPPNIAVLLSPPILLPLLGLALLALAPGLWRRWRAGRG